MTEIFTDISEEAKRTAETAWDLAQNLDPVQASNFINNVTLYFSNILNENEINFIRFYFNMKLEEAKNA